MEDLFFQERLANIKRSQQVVARTRKAVRENTYDALGYFGTKCAQLKEQQQSVQMIKEMSSTLFLRIADGMSLFQDGNGRMQAPLESEYAPQMAVSTTSPAKDKSWVVPTRLVGKSDFMRGVGKPQNNISNSLPVDELAPSNEFVNDDPVDKMNEDNWNEEDTCSSIANSEVMALVPDELPLKEDDDNAEIKQEEEEQEPVSDQLAQLTEMEKLSMLCTLINTLHFWEQERMLDGGWTSIKKSSTYTLIAAARESQKRLFKLLSTTDHSRPALCCAAICELVRAYPPEKLVPHAFVSSWNTNMEGLTISSYQGEEAASFWDMLVTFAISLMDEHGTTAEQVGGMLAAFLRPALYSVPDFEEGCRVLHLFMVSHICQRIMYKDSSRSSLQSKVDGCSENELDMGLSSDMLKLQVKKIEGGNKGLWNSVIGAWRNKCRKR